MRQACVLFLLLGGAQPAQAQIAESLLVAVEQVYRSMDAYHIAGEMALELNAEAQSQSLVMTLRMAERRPTHFRLDILGNRAPMQVVSNGDTSWVYSPTEDVYMRRFAALPPRSERADIPDILNGYKDLSGLSNVRREADSSCVVGEEALACIGVSFTRAAPGSSGAADTARTTLWIDPVRRVVLQDRMIKIVPESPFGGPATIVQTTTYSVVDVDGPLPDSLFTFAPQPGTEEVEQIPRFASLSSSLRGLPAPSFSLSRLDGTAVTLDSLRGKTVLLNFWATWCGPCRTEMLALQSIYEELQTDDLVVLGINEDESAADVTAFLYERGVAFPIVLDPVSAVGRLYEVNSIPNTLIINEEGIIVEHFVGARPESVFREALQRLGVR
jgi:peroxiredoxin/outer membrane lipoprotein-sorting protein